ncbi:hypothetical protein C8R44DRAFT_880383 [Mycena epipterygia]|nr:hypothetical protein C8R44DRAFT_880383 [Mycena epipterygia]
MARASLGASINIVFAVRKLENFDTYTHPTMSSFVSTLGTNDLVPFGELQSYGAGAVVYERYAHLFDANNIPCAFYQILSVIGKEAATENAHPDTLAMIDAAPGKHLYGIVHNGGVVDVFGGPEDITVLPIAPANPDYGNTTGAQQASGMCATDKMQSPSSPPRTFSASLGGGSAAAARALRAGVTKIIRYTDAVNILLDQYTWAFNQTPLAFRRYNFFIQRFSQV